MLRHLLLKFPCYVTFPYNVLILKNCYLKSNNLVTKNQ